MFVCLDLTRLRAVKRRWAILILNRIIVGEEGAWQYFRWTEAAIRDDVQLIKSQNLLEHFITSLFYQIMW